MNKLTQSDIEIMNAYNNRYGSETDLPKHIIEHWEEGKKNHLFQLFGDKLIYEKEITYGCSTCDNEEKLSRYTSFSEFKNDIYEQYSGRNTDKANILEGYVEEDRRWHLYNTLLLLIQKNKLIDNRCGYDDNVVVKGKTIKFSSNSKTLRILRKILTAIDYNRMELFEQLQTDVSTVIDEKVDKKGTLCISIHPMDYFTMSDNEYGWSSCMSWTEKGCHHEGTIGCLGGEDCVVAYIKGERDSADLGWNSKKWRQLVGINKSGIITNRHYPSHRPDVEQEVIKMLRTIAEKNMGWKYVEKPTNTSDARFGWIEMGIMYDDICNSSESVLVYVADDLAEGERAKFNFASNGCCFECGCQFEEDGVGNLVCYECQGVQWCPSCEEYVSDDHFTRVADGDYVCEYCLNEYYVWCEECDEYHYRDYCVYIEGLGAYVCEDCFNIKYKQCEECNDCYSLDDFEDGGSLCKHCREELEKQKAEEQSALPA